MKNSAEIFRPLVHPKRDVPKSSLPKYRVYSDAKHFVMVEAENAKVALATSGVKDALRIECDNILLQDIVIFSVTQPSPDSIEAAIDAPPAEPTQAPSPLSNDDVDKLLKN